MDRKHAYITLQKALREQYPPGPTLNAWLEWLEAVYAGDVKRRPPDTHPEKVYERSQRAVRASIAAAKSVRDAPRSIRPCNDHGISGTVSRPARRRKRMH